jgi:conjugative transfer signal peptidase TraF
MVQFDASWRQMRPSFLVATALSLIAILSTSPPASLGGPFIVNLTPSVPLGLYVRCRGRPRIGDYVVVSLPTQLRQFAAHRNYIPEWVLLIKIVRARAGDRVCRFGSRVWIGRHIAVWALRKDGAGHSLPAWSGCRRLRVTELFVLGTHFRSFDSRYFGPVSRRSILSVLRPIFIYGRS